MTNNISDYAWDSIYFFLQHVSGLHVKDEERTRCFVEGVWYVLRTGCQWRLLPTYYGDWRRTHKRYKQWADRGVWSDLMSEVSDIDDQSFMIDATVVRAHACASGYQKNGNEAQALGRSKGGFTTKIHALVDRLGNPVKFILTEGSRHDVTQAAELLKEQRNTTILADKGYDSQALIDTLKRQDCSAVIPPKINAKNPRKIDFWHYKERFLVEAFFSKMKHFRRVFLDLTKQCPLSWGFYIL